MLRLAVTTGYIEPGSELIQSCWESWKGEIAIMRNTPKDNKGVTGTLQCCYQWTQAELIAFLHSDLEIFEANWRERVIDEFEDSSVGIVGFGGALCHGHPDIYKVPYELGQLARFGYRSNCRDAEQHGERFEGSCDVAVLDGFALIIRRALLDQAGGWPVASLPFHCYDYWACVEAHRQGMRVRLVGVDCLHHGGAVSTTPAYQEWSLKVLGKTDAEIHAESHRWLYENARGYLPWKCGG